MPHVMVTVNNRSYTVACGEGEEQHLLDLAGFVDKQVQGLVKEVGQVGENRLLLMAALLISDQLSDLYGRVEDMRNEMGRMKGERTGTDTRAQYAESKVLEVLEKASARIEAIAERMSAS